MSPKSGPAEPPSCRNQPPDLVLHSVAKRRGEAVAKRARDRARLVKRQAKQAKPVARETLWLKEWSAASEAALLGEFARISAEYEANLMRHDHYTGERRRILTELGIETD